METFRKLTLHIIYILQHLAGVLRLIGSREVEDTSHSIQIVHDTSNFIGALWIS